MFWARAGMLLLGLLHSAAAYFYFSRSRYARVWAAGWIALAAATAWLLPEQPLLAYALFAAAIGLWTIWWASIRALPRRNWVEENARQSTGEIEENLVTIRNLRAFEWRGRRDHEPRWEDAVFDMEALEAVDLFTSTWGDPRIAHLIVSFVFRGAEPLAFSIETRRETDEFWSSLAGFMKSFELIVIAARETDVIRVRTNIRGEAVHRYRLVTTPAMRRRLLTQYVGEMNAIARRPRFYNTLFVNCTTEVARILRASGRPLPWSASILLSGFVPRYFHRIGLIDNARPFAKVERDADIGARARDGSSDPDFSRRIRSGPPEEPLAA
jgi:hypothetical protein